MESTLIGGASTPFWDDSLMRAFARADAGLDAALCMHIGIENPAGDIYRIVKTAGLNETVRVFESARDLGFDIAQGRLEGDQPLHRVLRRND
jgi:hypothetical protein